MVVYDTLHGRAIRGLLVNKTLLISGLTVKRKIAAILAADVVGYSRLVAEDEEEALTRLASYRAVFDDFIARFGGRIFNTAGDAILAEFHSAVDAVRCGVDLQESLRARNLAYPLSRHMSFRIGITIGDVVERDGDLLGDGVNIASRLESMAPPGGICISRSVYEAVANKLSVKFSDIGKKQLKNIPDPVHAYTLGPEVRATTQAASSPSASSLRLHWGVLAAVVIVGASIAGFMLNQVEQPSKREPAAPAANKASAPSTEANETAAEPSDDTTVSTTEPPETAVEEEPAPPKKVEPAPPKKVEPAPEVEPTPPKSEAPASTTIAISKPPPLPKTDPVVKEALIKRQWSACMEGEEAKRTIMACKAVIDYKISSGAQLALVHQKLGKAQRKDKDVDDAIDSYSESIGLAPSAEVYNDRGIAYFDKREWQKAIDDYTEAIRLDRNFGDAFNNRAWTQYTRGRASLALADANRAVELLPNKAYTWDTRGHINEALKNRGAAIRDYRKALELDSKSAGSRSGLKRLGENP